MMNLPLRGPNVGVDPSVPLAQGEIRLSFTHNDVELDGVVSAHQAPLDEFLARNWAVVVWKVSTNGWPAAF